ncbi:MAG: 6-carboxytetrahydropterin synthase QueD [Bryobacteraceae bacterium]|nr:6-carboxytetrahydropterin synthase QueD [Bryobacteraceae bacterium]
MFEISVQQTFSAGHALREYKGKCENVHGHNYRVEVTVAGEALNRIGLLVDFTDLKREMKAIIDRLDHQFVNDLEPFTKLNPSAENIARYFYDELQGSLRANEVPVAVTQVRLWETDGQSATFRP